MSAGLFSGGAPCFALRSESSTPRAEKFAFFAYVVATELVVSGPLIRTFADKIAGGLGVFAGGLAAIWMVCHFCSMPLDAEAHSKTMAYGRINGNTIDRYRILLGENP